MSAAGFPELFLRAHPGLPVKERTGMRNRLEHAYSDVDVAIV
ncbi:MAG: DUF86 domain-containing protein [Candidatus Thorarchaeota archaeon]|nr:DUF86 domain-containing protein [Candidatus Thorarchaeota archaeon]